jgi:ureidoacrylate peracid hydrolase
LDTPDGPALKLTHEIRREFAPQPGDIVTQEHFQRFANTDLDLQLKTHGIHKLIVIAHTCVEATGSLCR